MGQTCIAMPQGDCEANGTRMMVSPLVPTRGGGGTRSGHILRARASIVVLAPVADSPRWSGGIKPLGHKWLNGGTIGRSWGSSGRTRRVVKRCGAVDHFTDRVWRLWSATCADKGREGTINEAGCWGHGWLILGSFARGTLRRSLARRRRGVKRCSASLQ